MLWSVSHLAQFSVVAFTSIFFLVDPFAAIPAFLVMTAGDDAARRRRMARRAAWTCLIVLGSFGLAGSWIFRIFGITLPAFEIAGGLILLLIGIDMLQARRSSTQEVEPERREGAEKEDVGITPLGIPMLAGPGAISTVMVLIGPKPEMRHAIPVFAAIVVTSLISYWVLAGAEMVRRRLGETGIRILMRLMGLLLTAIAVQFFLNGLIDQGVIQRVSGS
jgi:multiple antibiotic resistance protein